MSQVFILFAVFFVLVVSNEWNYESLGPDIWSDFYPLCAGQSQSPINILTACTTHQSFAPFMFTLEKNHKYPFIVKNNGRTILAMADHTYDPFPIRLSGGGLNGTFDFVNFHIHWGENYGCGSEHQINGVKYAGEIHFVYHNSQTSQTAVLGVFMQSYFDTDQQISNEWREYFHIVSTLTSENDSIRFHLNFTALIERNLVDFWRYEGSLTTPPCTDRIIWTIFKQPILVLESQLNILRYDIFMKNYRQPKPLNDRKIYRNFFQESMSLISDYHHCTSDVTNFSIDLYLLIFLIFSSILIILYFVLQKNRDVEQRKKV